MSDPESVRVVGPAGNFASLPDRAKLVLCLAMIMGRLEILGVLVLFRPSFYRGGLSRGSPKTKPGSVFGARSVVQSDFVVCAVSNRP
jgi:hypothetical protein